MINEISQHTNKYKLDTYGQCECGYHLSPVWFTEDELIISDGHLHWTGRARKACSHLTCESCLKNYTVDDTFDGKWK